MFETLDSRIQFEFQLYIHVLMSALIRNLYFTDIRFYGHILAI